jgi:predicted type IV restriction endonuclease
MGRFPKRWPSRIRHCDFAIRLGEEIAFLVEAKSAAIKSLNSRHIEQASNYAANKGVNWVLLTNGVEWHLYHLTFSANGIVPDLVFELDFLEKLETEPDFAWDTLSVLAKRNVQENALDTYYERQKLLSPKTIVNTLVGEEVLMKIRQELNRKAPARLDVKDVFHAVMQVLNPEAVAAAGDITPPVKRRRRHRRRV